MRFSRNAAISGLFAFLFIGQLQSSFSARLSQPIEKKAEDKKVVEKVTDLTKLKTPEEILASAVPLAAYIAPPPLGPALALGLGIVYTANRFSQNPNTDMASQSKLMEEMKKLEHNIIQELNKKFDELSFTFNAYPLLRKMREQLESINSIYTRNIGCVLDKNCTGKPKDGIINEMLHPLSGYRNKLDDFNSQFMYSKSAVLGELHPDEFYFDFILQKNKNAEKENRDCYSESYHTRIFNAYTYIAKVLTEGYSIVIVSHAVRYQELSAKNDGSAEAETLRTSSNAILNQYLEHMKTLISVAKGALEKSSREIRKCGPFTFKQGETFDRFKFFGPRFVEREGNLFGICHELHGKKAFDNDGFTLFNCSTELLIPDRVYDLYYTWEDGKTALHHMSQNHHPDGSWADSEKKYGYDDQSKSFERQVCDHANRLCPHKLCYSYRHRPQVTFSTQYVQASPFHVITGLRWRISKDVIYIDIQQGLFIDGTHVKESTVQWMKTPENKDQVLTTDWDSAGVLLNDVVLPAEYYVTGVEMMRTNGKMELVVTGLKAVSERGRSDLSAKKVTDFQRGEKIKTELEMNGLDDPATVPVNSTTVVMRSTGKHYVKFHPTDLEKTFGLRTIPYFDLQEVVTYPPAPISGIGVYYKAVPGYGGFLGLKMLSPDLSHMLNFKNLEKFAQSSEIEKKQAI